MSRGSPCSNIMRNANNERVMNLERNKNIATTKLKLQKSVILKIFSGSLKKARVSLRSRRSNNEEELYLLNYVEREFVQSLVNVKRKKNSFDEYFLKGSQRTPELKMKGMRIKKGNMSTSKSRRRNNSLYRKVYNNCITPKDVLFGKANFEFC